MEEPPEADTVAGRSRGLPVPQRAARLLWIVVSLVPLLDAGMAVPELEPAWPAVAGLTVLVSGYVAVTWTGLCWPAWQVPGTPGRLRLAGLGMVTLLGTALAAGYADGPGNWLITLFYVALAGTATVPAPRFAIGWLAGTVAVLVVLAMARDVPPDRVSSAALTIVLAGAVIVMFLRMSELIERLRRTRAELAETAVTAERSRFSRDLHDLLGHTLSLIVVKAEVARRSASEDPATTEREAREIEQIGRRALSEVREAVTGYRERAFTSELDAARTALTDAGLRVTIRAPDPPLPAPADSLFGWVVREASTNVVRHSGARHCDIDVRHTDGHATLEVRDDGVGGVGGGVGGVGGASQLPTAAGYGLHGVAERLTEVGGRLEAGEAKGGGWRLAATVPVTSREQP